MDAKTINDMLPFVLKRENVARYREGRLEIGDRRKYPFEKTFHICEDVEGVARAVEEMVTQGGGPAVAAAYALAMAARQAAALPAEKALARLKEAKTRLVNTRPTNTAMALWLEELQDIAEKALEEGEDAEAALLASIESRRDRDYEAYYRRARFGADLMQDRDGILTMCFAETSFLLALALAKQDGKRIQVFVPETRPYLQGARLTAPSIQEIGIPVTLIGDSMPAYLMSQGKIQKYFTAADLITLDGHVVNKIGTFQLAIAAHHHGIPYFAFMWGADPGHPDRDSIRIEERDQGEMRSCRDVATTLDSIPAYYPAFDITPPYLVSGIITAKGIFSPYDLHRHFE